MIKRARYSSVAGRLVQLAELLRKWHINIGLCAAAWLISTSRYFQLSVDFQLSYTALVAALAAIWIYWLDRVFENASHEADQTNITWAKSGAKVLKALLLGLLVLVISLGIKRSVWVLLIPAALPSVLYALPILGPAKRSLRDYPLAKIFLIALVWAWVCTIPIFVKVSTETQSLGLLLLSRFLFAIAVTLPFDLRDVHKDSKRRVLTLPQLLGVSRTLSLARMMAFASALAIALGPFPKSIILAHLLSVLYLVSLVWLWRPDREQTYYAWGLDGSLLVQSGLVLLLSGVDIG